MYIHNFDIHLYIYISWFQVFAEREIERENKLLQREDESCDILDDKLAFAIVF